MVGTAESLLTSLQDVLLEAAKLAGDEPPSGDADLNVRSSVVSGRQNTKRRSKLREIEHSYGPSATRFGRMLSELVSGSYAWDLFPDLRGPEREGPRIYELCRCEPVLRAMRASGELAEREELLQGRNTRFAALWQDSTLTDEDRRYETETLYADYF